MGSSGFVTQVASAPLHTVADRHRAAGIVPAPDPLQKQFLIHNTSTRLDKIENIHLEVRSGPVGRPDRRPAGSSGLQSYRRGTCAFQSHMSSDTQG